jgi:hypothetical protein
MAANQQHIAALLKALMEKGIESKDAIPTIKRLVEAKVYTLADLNENNIPSTIDETIQRKILPKRKTKGSSNSTSEDGCGDGRIITTTTNNNNNSNSNNHKRRKTRTTSGPMARPEMISQPPYILINRSPVLTLWSTIVAQKSYPGVTLPEAVSLGSAVAAQLAQAKGTSLGIYQNKNDSNNDTNSNNNEGEKKTKDNDTKPGPGHEDNDDKDSDSLLEFYLLGLVIYGRETPDGLRAMITNQDGQRQQRQQYELDPHKTWNLLHKRFGNAFGFVMERMDKAAEALLKTGQLEVAAYHYYMHIRPDIPTGTKGWGAHGRLYTDKLSSFTSPRDK